VTRSSAQAKAAPAPAAASRRIRSSDPVELTSLAELVVATTAQVADRARAVLAPVLAHQALVIVAPANDSLPVRISGPAQIRERLAAIDWSGIVGGAIPSEDGAARFVVPDAIAGLRTAGWVATSAGYGVALIVGAPHRLEIGPAQDQAARLVATLAAARGGGISDDPGAGTLAFAHAISQERDRVQWELTSRHAATLTALLKTLRNAAGSGPRGTPPGVAMAIDLTSQALLELKASGKREDALSFATLPDAFGDAETELSQIARGGELQLICGLEGPDDGVVPRAIARAARIFSCEAALNATHHSGADKLRIRWRLTDDALLVTVADNGDGFNDDHPRRHELRELGHRVASLGATVELDSAPRWGTAVSCLLPLRSLSLAPSTAATDRFSELRAREREVLELMVAGLRNRDIAERLFITIRTVKFHVSNILHKLEANSRAEVIVLAHSAGISVPEER
jgi:DNA-binding CsgD family transcriptional regulator